MVNSKDRADDGYMSQGASCQRQIGQESTG